MKHIGLLFQLVVATIALVCFGLLWFALVCVALRCFALLCVALRCFALRCFALLCVALRCSPCLLPEEKRLRLPRSAVEVHRQRRPLQPTAVRQAKQYYSVAHSPIRNAPRFPKASQPATAAVQALATKHRRLWPLVADCRSDPPPHGQ